jgi:Stress responsive A/B Barrel Domain
VPLGAERIRHTVAFNLVHEGGSEQERGFLEAVARLASIPDVEEFELFDEVSPKNNYRFALSMEFRDEQAYSGYNEHPDHVRFVQERWLPEVREFLELDYTARNPGSE